MLMTFCNSYLSYKDKGFEIRQLRVFNEMVKKGTILLMKRTDHMVTLTHKLSLGYIYRQLKPVYWSPSSQLVFDICRIFVFIWHIANLAFRTELR